MTTYDKDEALRLIALIRDRQEDQTTNRSGVKLADQLEAAVNRIEGLEVERKRLQRAILESNGTFAKEQIDRVLEVES